MKLYAVHNDRVFEYLSHTEYQRKDGSAGRLATWRAMCRECGASFQITTSAAIGTVVASKAFARVHCDLHKRPPPKRK